MLNKYFAEFLGTLILTYVIFATGDHLAIGAALVVILMVIGSISGGHLNPAVSIVMMHAGKLPRSDLMPYIVAQVAGAITAFQLFKMVQ